MRDSRRDIRNKRHRPCNTHASLAPGAVLPSIERDLQLQEQVGGETLLQCLEIGKRTLKCVHSYQSGLYRCYLLARRVMHKDACRQVMLSCQSLPGTWRIARGIAQVSHVKGSSLARRLTEAVVKACVLC